MLKENRFYEQKCTFKINMTQVSVRLCLLLIAMFGFTKKQLFIPELSNWFDPKVRLFERGQVGASIINRQQSHSRKHWVKENPNELSLFDLA